MNTLLYTNDLLPLAGSFTLFFAVKHEENDFFMGWFTQGNGDNYDRKFNIFCFGECYAPWCVFYNMHKFWRGVSFSSIDVQYMYIYPVVMVIDKTKYYNPHNLVFHKARFSPYGTVLIKLRLNLYKLLPK